MRKPELTILISVAILCQAVLGVSTIAIGSYLFVPPCGAKASNRDLFPAPDNWKDSKIEYDTWLCDVENHGAQSDIRQVMADLKEVWLANEDIEVILADRERREELVAQPEERKKLIAKAWSKEKVSERMEHHEEFTFDESYVEEPLENRVSSADLKIESQNGVQVVGDMAFVLVRATVTYGYYDWTGEADAALSTDSYDEDEYEDEEGHVDVPAAPQYQIYLKKNEGKWKLWLYPQSVFSSRRPQSNFECYMTDCNASQCGGV